MIPFAVIVLVICVDVRSSNTAALTGFDESPSGSSSQLVSLVKYAHEHLVFPRMVSPSRSSKGDQIFNPAR